MEEEDRKPSHDSRLKKEMALSVTMVAGVVVGYVTDNSVINVSSIYVGDCTRMCHEIEYEIGKEKLVGTVRFGIIRVTVLADSLSLRAPP